MIALLVGLSLLNLSGYSQPSASGVYTASPASAIRPANPGYEIARAPENAAVSIQGNVVRPGEYEYQSGLTLDILVSRSGSFTSVPDYENIQIQRNGTTYSLNYRIKWQRLVVLEPGDVVVVPDRSLWNR